MKNNTVLIFQIQCGERVGQERERKGEGRGKEGGEWVYCSLIHLCLQLYKPSILTKLSGEERLTLLAEYECSDLMHGCVAVSPRFLSLYTRPWSSKMELNQSLSFSVRVGSVMKESSTPCTDKERKKRNERRRLHRSSKFSHTSRIQSRI